MPILIVGAALAGLVLVLLLGRRARLDEHSPEYRQYIVSPLWRQHARRCFGLTHRRCCLLPWLRAVEAHHLHYRNFKQEWVLRDTVPLSALGHRIVHAWLFWRGPLRPLANAGLRVAAFVVALLVRPVLGVVVVAAVAGLCWWGLHLIHGVDIPLLLNDTPGGPLILDVLQELDRLMRL